MTAPAIIALIAACVVLPTGPQYYRVVGEVGIVGHVIDHAGNEVLFVPCVGRPQVLSMVEIEPTLNTCKDWKLP